MTDPLIPIPYDVRHEVTADALPLDHILDLQPTPEPERLVDFDDDAWDRT